MFNLLFLGLGFVIGLIVAGKLSFTQLKQWFIDLIG